MPDNEEAMTAGQVARREGMFSALGQRRFRLLWWSGVGQSIGLGMQQITLGYYVFDLTRSGFWVGAVAFMGFIPFFFFSPVAGSLGDRMDRRTLLAVAQASSGAAILTLALLILTGQAAIWQVLVVALVSSTGQALTVPIRFAFVTDLVERPYLLNAVALNSLSQNVARTAGPVLAGVLIAALDAGGTMMINASGYLLGLIPLMRLPATGRPEHAPQGSVLGAIGEGVRYSLATPVILYALLLSNFGFSLFGMVYISMMPVFAKEVLGRGSLGLGMLSAAAGLGSVVGALVLARLGDYPHKRRLFQGFYLLFFGALLVFTLSPSYPLSMVALIFAGAGSASHISVGSVMVQTETPRELQGRVMSLWTWGICLNFLGALPVGALSEVYGAPAAMTGSILCGLLFGAAVMIRYHRILPGREPAAVESGAAS